jgi:hypothetical protein
LIIQKFRKESGCAGSRAEQVQKNRVFQQPASLVRAVGADGRSATQGPLKAFDAELVRGVESADRSTHHQRAEFAEENAHLRALGGLAVWVLTIRQSRAYPATDASRHEVREARAPLPEMSGTMRSSMARSAWSSKR